MPYTSPINKNRQLKRPLRISPILAKNQNINIKVHPSSSNDLYHYP